MAKENNSAMGTILIIIVLIGLGVLIYFLFNKSVKNNMEEEYLENYENEQSNDLDTPPSDEEMLEEMESFQNNQNVNNMDHLSADSKMQGERSQSNFPKEQLGADDLLPKDDSSLWAQVNPAGEGSLKDRNFLQSGYHIGINTVGQTLRNANQQLRSEPPNPQVKVSPWLQTTIEPDLGRKPLEIGGCA